MCCGVCCGARQWPRGASPSPAALALPGTEGLPFPRLWAEPLMVCPGTSPHTGLSSVSAQLPCFTSEETASCRDRAAYLWSWGSQGQRDGGVEPEVFTLTWEMASLLLASHPHPVCCRQRAAVRSVAHFPPQPVKYQSSRVVGDGGTCGRLEGWSG